jgi:hypothetical protein
MLLKLTPSPLNVESCVQMSKSKLSNVSSNIRSPEQTFFSLDDFRRPLRVAVVTVFSHLTLAPAVSPRASTTKNRLENIFNILFYVSLVSLAMLLIWWMEWNFMMFEVVYQFLYNFIRPAVRTIFIIRAARIYWLPLAINLSLLEKAKLRLYWFSHFTSSLFWHLWSIMYLIKQATRCCNHVL